MFSCRKVEKLFLCLPIDKTHFAAVGWCKCTINDRILCKKQCSKETSIELWTGSRLAGTRRAKISTKYSPRLQIESWNLQTISLISILWKERICSFQEAKSGRRNTKATPFWLGQQWNRGGLWLKLRSAESSRRRIKICFKILRPLRGTC